MVLRAASPTARRQKITPAGTEALGFSLTRRYSKCPEWLPFQFPGVVFEKPRKVDAEVVQRQVGDGDAAAQVFEVDHGVLKLEQLLAPVFQIVHLVAGLVLDDVLFARRGDVEQDHPAADALFEVDVLLELDVGPEVDELDALVRRADAVDAAEPLDDPHRVPVDVVVDRA